MTSRGVFATLAKIAPNLDRQGMREFSRNFWIYFFSGLFWSSGLMVFFLVYNLHLLEIGLNETAIGEITSASTLGSLAATLVTGKLLNHCGQIRFIQCCVLVTALLLPLRSLAHGMGFLTATAFLNGTSIAGWMVSAPPFLTHNTDPGNRAWAYSLSYGSSVGCGALAGLLVGFASHEGPAWAELREFAGFSAKQSFLLGSAASVLLGFFGLLFLRLADSPIGTIGSERVAEAEVVAGNPAADSCLQKQGPPEAGVVRLGARQQLAAGHAARKQTPIRYTLSGHCRISAILSRSCWLPRRFRPEQG
ncbi:MAG: MFS transporter [Acidimicrobiia bacterium]|nr:MFS transporter [Acidimicrobiia bacterium]